MREFAYGSDEQYAQLKNMLQDHLCHVYPSCILPSHCSRTQARIGFEKKNDDTYELLIDKGINCNYRTAPMLFKEWLTVGTLRFLEFNDLKQFLISLKCLY